MGILQNDAQIVKGNVQKIKGGVQDKTGHPIKGEILKAKGEANIIAGQTKREEDREPTNADVV